MSQKELLEEIESELYGDEADSVVKMAEAIDNGRSLLAILDETRNELAELQSAYGVATSANAKMAQDLVDAAGRIAELEAAEAKFKRQHPGPTHFSISQDGLRITCSDDREPGKTVSLGGIPGQAVAAIASAGRGVSYGTVPDDSPFPFPFQSSPFSPFKAYSVRG